jgi:hypothetical protein
LIVGNPGRISGWMCACGVKLAGGKEPPPSATCASCGTNYRSDNGVLIQL